MGGYGSGRYGLGGQKSKQTVAAFAALSIAQLKQDGKIKPATTSVLVRAKSRQQKIEITRTACHYGGDRPWLVCPKCGKRAGKLYTHECYFHYQCRKCWDLAYPSNRYSDFDAAIARINRIKSKLDSNRDGEPIRPKGMHRRTYAALLAELDSAEMAKERAITASIQSIFRGLTAIDFSKLRIDSM
jgi:hypothetical protein